MKWSFLLLLLISTVYNVFAQSKPNIVFILTDDLGYGDVGVFNQNQRKLQNIRSNPYTQTPNIDRLANTGAMLMQHYSAAPVCAPSRASLMLGQSQGHANVRDNQFDKALEDNYTMPGVLKKLGYSTAIFGKWGLQGDNKFTPNGDAWPAHPLKRGFDHFYGYMRHADGHEHYPKEGLYRGKKEVWDDYKEVSQGLDKCYTADLWAASAKQWIIDNAKLPAKKPFFVFLSFDTPHAVVELPTQEYPKGGGLHGGLQWLGKPGQMINTASGTIDSYHFPDYANATYDNDGNPATAEVAWPDVYQRYATAVRRIDDAVGDIMQLLKDLKIDENTMVVFSSDNGPSIESYLPEPYAANFFGSFGPFDGIKRDCWEGGLRMPAIANWKNHIPAGKKINEPNSAYDWLATFANVAGSAAPVKTDGVSMLPVLTGKGTAEKSQVYVEYFEPGKTPGYKEFDASHRGRKRGQMQVIRLGDYVGVRYDIKSAADDFEIYDAIKDPGEKNNLAAQPSMASMQTKMKEAVVQMRMPDTSAVRPYDAALLTPVATEKTMPGVAWHSCNEKFNWLPATKDVKITANGSAKSIEQIDTKSAAEGFVFVDGFIDVPADGAYSFYTNGDAQCLLRIHQSIVIDNDFSAGKKQTAMGKILLKEGRHPFKFCYKKTTKVPVLQWESSQISKQIIPSSAFVHS